MADPPNVDGLLNLAAALAHRADRLAVRAQHPFTRDQIGQVGVAARHAFSTVRDSRGAERPRADVATTLSTLGGRLDELEDLLNTHGADAIPLGLA